MTMTIAATTTAMRTDDNDGLLQPYPRIHEDPRRLYDDVDGGGDDDESEDDDDDDDESFPLVISLQPMSDMAILMNGWC